MRADLELADKLADQKPEDIKLADQKVSDSTLVDKKFEDQKQDAGESLRAAGKSTSESATSKEQNRR